MSQFHGQGARVRYDRTFGAGIHRMLGSALQSVNGRNVTDGPASVRQHVAHDLLRQEELGPDIDAVQQIKLLASDLQERLVQGDPRVVHQAVDAPEEFDGSPSQFGHRVEVVEVRLDHHRPAPQRSDCLSGGLRSRPAVGVVEHDVGALAGKLQGDLAPNPCTGAGDQGTLAGKFRVGVHDIVSGKVNGLPCSSWR